MARPKFLLTEFGIQQCLESYEHEIYILLNFNLIFKTKFTCSYHQGEPELNCVIKEAVACSTVAGFLPENAGVVNYPTIHNGRWQHCQQWEQYHIESLLKRGDIKFLKHLNLNWHVCKFCKSLPTMESDLSWMSTHLSETSTDPILPVEASVIRTNMVIKKSLSMLSHSTGHQPSLAEDIGTPITDFLGWKQ